MILEVKHPIYITRFNFRFYTQSTKCDNLYEHIENWFELLI